MNIFQLIQKNNKSLVVVVNKWDLVRGKESEGYRYLRECYPQAYGSIR